MLQSGLTKAILSPEDVSDVFYSTHKSLYHLLSKKIIGNEFQSRNAVEHRFIDVDKALQYMVNGLVTTQLSTSPLKTYTGNPNTPKSWCVYRTLLKGSCSRININMNT